MTISEKTTLDVQPPADASFNALDVWRAWEQRIVSGMNANPLESLTALVGLSAAVLYWAENGKNDKIRTYWDAFHYVATSVSVGYANIFPETALGKSIGSLVMMIGPALSSRVLNNVGPSQAATSADATAMINKLDEILVELRRLGNAR